MNLISSDTTAVHLGLGPIKHSEVLHPKQLYGFSFGVRNAHSTPHVERYTN